jgi:predicted SprT family Zn-dependent metalloprotease
MDLDKAELRAIDALREHGLIERGWTFKFDNAPRRFGYCSWATKTISLSRKLVLLNEEREVQETILHEVAHALHSETRGRSDHGPEWRRIAQSIGCTGRRCYDAANVKTPPRRATIDLSAILAHIEED